MTITNVKYYRDLPFDEYLKMHGTSFSSLKGDIPESAGMALGKRVHAYLNEPGTYDGGQREEVRPIAAALRGYIGNAMPHLEKEIAFTCYMHHNGLTLAYKGRADLLRIGRIVIDLKVLAGSLTAACERYGYPNQLSGYCLGTGCGLGLIVAYNKARKEVETKVIKPSMDFWNYTIVQMGMPI